MEVKDEDIVWDSENLLKNLILQSEMRGNKERIIFSDAVFMKKGFRNWKRALERFKDHVGELGSAHRDCETQYFAYIDQRQSIVHSASDAKDGVRDSSVKEQMPFILRYVDKFGERNDALRQKQLDQIVQNLEKSEKTTGTRMYQEISLARPGETRWGSHYKTIIRILAMWSTVLEVLGDSRLLHLDELYPDDFSSSDMMQLNEQLKVYIIEIRRKKHFANLDGIGVLAKKMAELDFHHAFHLVYRLMELALVLPVATTSVERTFLAMKIIKTNFRNKIDDDFLNVCMVCYIEKEIFLQADNEVILDHFQNMKTLRNLLREKK
ncbi:uncharacterized protein LOC141695822 [Apium graveolens]|uniref:uncharacterized protein LOC141695822 n=1 Tax=Apium graveolens TaxID=4045 RepID=UPI003D7A4200